MIYNPAGLALIGPDKRSVSYNSYMTARYRIDQILFGSTYEATLTNTPFFVGTTYRSKNWDSWTIAAAAYDRSNYNNRQRWGAKGSAMLNIGNELKQVDGEFETVTRNSGSELTVAVAVARHTAFGAWGATLGGRYERTSYQNFSETAFGPFDFPSAGMNGVISHAVSNSDSQATGYGPELTLGGLWRLSEEWTGGLSLSQLYYLNQTDQENINSHNYYLNPDGTVATSSVGDAPVPIAPTRQYKSSKEDEPFGRPPLHYRLGVARTVGEASRISGEVLGRSAGRSTAEYKTYPGADLAAGFETRLVPTIVWRSGVYTAWDTSNVVSRRGVHRQDTYVDSVGMTTGASYVASGWSLGASAMYQHGRGKSYNYNTDTQAPIRLSLTTVSAHFVSDQ